VELIVLVVLQMVYSFVMATLDILRTSIHGINESYESLFSHNFWTFSLYFNHPKISLVLILVSLLYIGRFAFLLHRSYYALEDRFTAGTSRFADRDELLEQYPLMPADMSIPFDDTPGLPIAHFSYEEVERLTDSERKEDLIPGAKGHVRFLDDSQEEKTEANNAIQKKNDFLISIAQEVTNVCIIGITRSGKKVFSVGPILDSFSRPRSIEKRASFIISDPKGELIQENYQLLKKRGYKIKVLNLMHTYQSTPYNPFAGPIKDYARWMNKELSLIERNEALDSAEKAIMNIAFTFYENPEAKNPMWGDNAQLLFTAIAMILIEHCISRKQTERVALYSMAMTLENMSGERIYRWDHPFLKKYTTNEDELKDMYVKYKGLSTLDVLFDMLPLSHPARALYGGIKLVGAAKETIGGIGTHVFSGLKTYIQPGIATLMARNDFDFDEMGYGDQPVATFMIIPDQDKSNHKLATFFIEQSYKRLVDLAFDAPGQKCKRPVIYLLDEFGNLPPLNDIQSKLTAGLGRNIRFFLILQSFSQLRIYPEGTDDTILSNCGYTFLIKTPSKSTTELISERLGKRAVLDINRSGKWFSINKDETEMVKTVELMTVTELEQMQFSENVILRIMKNEDLKKNLITAYPILNQGSARFHPYYHYIPQDFTEWKDIPEAHSGAHRELELGSLLVDLEPPEYKEQGLKKEEESQAADEPDKENVSSPVVHKQRTRQERIRLRILHDIVPEKLAKQNPGSFFYTTEAIERLAMAIRKNCAERGFAEQAVSLLSGETSIEDFFSLIVAIEEPKGFKKIADILQASRKEVVEKSAT
jgi:type IV secretory pathway TraG/TraD family ATPase VirD4